MMKPKNKEIFRNILKEGNETLYNHLLSTENNLLEYWNRASQGPFTNHGQPHIKMVESYVGKLLGKRRLENYIFPEEFFILLLGVFCHDLGMMKFSQEETRKGEVKIKIERDSHNVSSYQFVTNETINKRIIVPNSEYYKPIALLCLGHRNYKDKEGKTVNTLVDKCDIDGKKVRIDEIISIDDTDIHLQYLAAILRLADELDVTNTRAPEDVKMYFKDFITEPSYDHWVKHQLIKKVSFEENGVETIIKLVPNVEKITSLTDGTEDNIQKDQLLRLIFSVRKKIEKEIEQINKITFSSKSVDDDIAVKFDIQIKFDNEVVTEADFERYQTNVDNQKTEESNGHLKDPSDNEESEEIAKVKKKPIDIFNEELQKLKKDCNLLETGSFKFSFEKGKNEFTQFFINTQLLLTNRNTLDSITDIFCDKFSKNKIDCVIGIGKAGIILAPNLSLKLKCNSSYLISKWEDTSSVDWERRVSVIDTAKNVLVLLDVISTGTVTMENLERIKKKNEIHLENIYVGTVFCTNKAVKEKIEKEDKVKEMFSINNDFQFRTYSQEEFDNVKNKEFRKEFELLPLRKNRL